jgi:hypothetical protein
MEVSGQRRIPAALPRGKNPGAHCTGDWMGTRTGVNILEKKLTSKQKRVSTRFISYNKSHSTK